MDRSARLGAALVIALGCASGMALLLAAVGRTWRAGVTTPDQVIAVVLPLAGVALLGWYLLTAALALVCVTARLVGGSWAAGERTGRAWGAPLARRLLAVGAGAAVAAATLAAPATALTTPVEVQDDLGWGAEDVADDDDDPPVPTTPTEDAPEPTTPEPTTAEPTTAASAAAASAADRSPAPDGASHTVAPGDSLWGIAAAHLPDDASDAAVAAAWPLWFETNRDVIGPDPDVIQPGQVLRAPDLVPEESS